MSELDDVLRRVQLRREAEAKEAALSAERERLAVEAHEAQMEAWLREQRDVAQRALAAGIRTEELQLEASKSSWVSDRVKTICIATGIRAWKIASDTDWWLDIHGNGWKPAEFEDQDMWKQHGSWRTKLIRVWDPAPVPESFSTWQHFGWLEVDDGGGRMRIPPIEAFAEFLIIGGMLPARS